MALYVNNSLLRLLRECETKTWLRWKFERVPREREGPGPMEIGSVMHRCLEQWMKGEKVDFTKHWEEIVGDVLPQQERFYPGNVENILAHWIAVQDPQRRNYALVEAEHILEATIGFVDGEEIIYYGTIDALIEWTGQLWLLEHKTTGRLDLQWENQWGMSAQLMGYVWLLRKHNHAVRGAIVNGIEIRKLPPWDGNYAKKCSTHKMKYAECQWMHVKHVWVGPLVWTSARLEKWRLDVLAQVGKLLRLRDIEKEGIAQITMDGQFLYPGCAKCMYQQFCKDNRPVGRIEGAFVHEQWKTPREEPEDED